jgi:uroporphyrinogen-III synthase
MNTQSAPLNQLNILVTRPQSLAGRLAKLIEDEGGNALLYPVISIIDVENPKKNLQILERLAVFDIAIFISPTAVRKTFEQVATLPTSLQIAAIGSSTVDALEHQGLHASIKPDGHDSEALLKHKQLQSEAIHDKSIIIFRGAGGREHLANSLRERGASVEYAEVYQRVRSNNLTPLTETAINTLDVITISSNEGLQNLFDMNTHTQLLTLIPIIVPGARANQLAKTLGFTTVIQAENATNAAYINALKHWSSA